MTRHPIVLCIGGHDPTGGAGIQADIETVGTLGARAVTVISALTTQDSNNIRALHPNPEDAFAAQLDTLLADIHPQAVKIGLLGSAEVAGVLAARLQHFDGAVILDPVLAAGGGYDVAGNSLLDVIRTEMLPRVTLATPNRAEARRLGDHDDPAQAARALLAAGCDAVLVTGADEADGDSVTNRLFHGATLPRDFVWPRLPHVYHGSGCTLASACAARLAHGDAIAEAVQAAQEFTWRALQAAERPGGGQWLPRRLP